MMKCNVGMIALWTLFVLTGCKSQAPFTTSLKTEIEDKGLSTHKLQYYTDRDITIRKEVTSDIAKVKEGEVSLVNGKQVQLITLSKKTPGVCVQDSAGILSIAFEGGERSFFRFKPSGQDGGYYIMLQDSVGNILYDDKVYRVVGSGKTARLTIRKKEADKLQVNKRRMKGMKL